MDNVEAKAYVNKRYDEILKDNPNWLRVRISNVIMKELRDEYNFWLTVPTGQRILSITEDYNGLVFQVQGTVE
jgi:hypothetical protein